MLSRRLVLALAAAAALLGPAGANPQTPPPTATVTVTTFVITGHGWGHGVGMAQWGAYGYAQNGATYDEILAHYYPGTQLTQALPAPLRILLAAGKTLTVTSAADFQVQDALGQSHPLSAGSYALDATLTLPDVGPLQAPLLFRPGQAPLQLGAPYRGSIEIDVSRKKLLAVNVVGLDAYIRGVIPREMPKDWPLEALKAQAVAARSYALAARRGG